MTKKELEQELLAKNEIISELENKLENRSKENKKIRKENRVLKIKYKIMIKAFSLTADALYDKTMVFKTQKSLEQYRGYLLMEACK